MTDKKPRKFVHVPFDRMTCPVSGCDTMDGKPQEGTVPGIKRHVRHLHPSQYDKIDWPEIRVGSESKPPEPEVAVAPATIDLTKLGDMHLDDLRKLAKGKVTNYSSMKKDELLKALANA